MTDLFAPPTFVANEPAWISLLSNDQGLVRYRARVLAVNDLGILAEDERGYQQWFDLDNRRRCPGCGQVCGYLEKRDTP